MAGVSGAPAKRMSPAVGRAKPSMHLKVVVLPEPLGPSSPQIEPAGTSSETPSTAANEP